MDLNLGKLQTSYSRTKQTSLDLRLNSWNRRSLPKKKSWVWNEKTETYLRLRFVSSRTMSKRCALFSPLCKHTPSQPHVARMLRNAKTKNFRANLQSLILKLIPTCHPSWRLCTYLIFVKSTTKLLTLRLATLLVKKAPSERIFRLKCSDLSQCSRRQVLPPITL